MNGWKHTKPSNIRFLGFQETLPKPRRKSMATAQTILNRVRIRPGEGTQLFFGGCVPHRFQNVGSRERIFLKKMGVLGTKILKNLGLESYNFCQNMVEKWKISLKIENRGHKSSILMVNWWARERRLAWKKGVMTAAHPYTPFKCECPPRNSTVSRSKMLHILDILLHKFQLLL